MSDNVVPFSGKTRLDIPVVDVLVGALKAELQHVLVIGRTKDGDVYHAASSGDTPLMLTECDLFKHMMLREIAP